MSKDILRDLRGFGTVEKWVLTDPKIHASAKGLYALLCAFAGDKGHAFPGTELLRHQLGLSKNTLHKYIKQLEEFGVVKVEQERKGGKFSQNIYSLLPQGYALTVSQNLGDHKMGDQKMGSQNLDTNNNSLKSNSNKNNSLKGEEGKPSLLSDDNAPKKISAKEQIDLVVEAWNEIAPRSGLQEVVAITTGSTRDRQLRARLKQFKVEGFIRAIKLVEMSRFLQGHNKDGWVITFDWLIRPSNFQKVLEGNYNSERKGVNNHAGNSNNHVPYGIQAQEQFARDARDAYARSGYGNDDPL